MLNSQKLQICMFSSPVVVEFDSEGPADKDRKFDLLVLVTVFKVTVANFTLLNPLRYVKLRRAICH